MWALIRNGGVVPMSFILGSGLLAIVSAFYFAVRAQRRTLGFIKGMATATLFATLGTTCADVGATLNTAEKAWDPSGSFAKVPGPPGVRDDEASRTPHALHIVVAGLAESTSPGILGFSMLALTAMLVAVGRRRLDERTGDV